MGFGSYDESEQNEMDHNHEEDEEKGESIDRKEGEVKFEEDSVEELLDVYKEHDDD